MKYSSSSKYSAIYNKFVNKFTDTPSISLNFFNSNNIKVPVTETEINVNSEGFTIVDFDYDDSDTSKIPASVTWTATGEFLENVETQDTSKNYINLGKNMIITGTGSVTRAGEFKVYRDDVEIYDFKNEERKELEIRVNDVFVMPKNSSFTANGVNVSLAMTDDSLRFTVVGASSRFSFTVDKEPDISLGVPGTYNLPEDVTFKIYRNNEEFDGTTLLSGDKIVFTNPDNTHNINITSTGVNLIPSSTDSPNNSVEVSVSSEEIQSGFVINVVKTQRAKTIDVRSAAVSIQRGTEIVGVLAEGINTFELQSGDILIVNGVVTGTDVVISQDNINYTVTDLGSNYKIQITGSHEDQSDIESDIESDVESSIESGI